MKREFSFQFALLIALLFHALLGVVLKLNPLQAATPAITRSTPLSVRFVEVPPDAKTIPVTPNTNNVSDANRKAGPLIKREEEGIRSAPAAVQHPGVPGHPVAASKQSPLPGIQSPDLDEARNKPDSSAIAVPHERLTKSLQNLDQFIGKGGVKPKGGGPSGDTGSGVFFDTRGYDLGPWGNRVVAIVKSNWLIPVAAELGVKGIVAISFEVDRVGNILNPQVISTSGVPSFDQAALNSLKTSNPFPPLPADFPRPTLPAIFRFYYNSPVPD